jgi:hypothetical protein
MVKIRRSHQREEISGVVPEESRKLQIVNSGASVCLIDATSWLFPPFMPNLDDVLSGGMHQPGFCRLHQLKS